MTKPILGFYMHCPGSKEILSSPVASKVYTSILHPETSCQWLAVAVEVPEVIRW